jgi:aspartyl-tRNA(Asn)/glutamyl-tRNA(Gln) amidotransferase subunit B
VRVDANISIKGFNRAEVKNINSFKEVERALKWEIQRQKNLIKRGKQIEQETRHWDESNRITISLRKKEFEKDYRYFPEQNLVPIELKRNFITNIKQALPEMPNERIKRFQEGYELSEFESEILVLDKALGDFFEKTIDINDSLSENEFKQLSNWLKGDISRWLNEHNTSIDQTELKPEQLINLINYIEEGKITGKIAKTFIDDLMKGVPVSKIIQESGKKRLSNQDKLKNIAEVVIEENPEIVKDYESNPRAIEALIGKCMQKTKGQADPSITRKLLKKLLEKN